LLGDAIHRHSPAYGLGRNPCLQEAYDLAWKLAFVKKGLAGRRLLDTYNMEWQPVGARLVVESNEFMRQHLKLWSSLGMFAETVEEGMRQIEELSDDESTENPDKDIQHRIRA
jgi:2-polyprenyl-6-methoxyphenol hydroxylase-like FAD-dependent oxidoreductase